MRYGRFFHGCVFYIVLNIGTLWNEYKAVADEAESIVIE